MTREELAAEIERLVTAFGHAIDDRYMEKAAKDIGYLVGFYPQAILAALREPDEAAVERGAVALALSCGANFANVTPGAQASYREDVQTVLRAAREG